MHAAPSVSYPVGRSMFALALTAGLVLAALVVAVVWTAQAAQAGWRQALAFAAVAASGAYAAFSWWRSPAGLLRWDGSAWNWEEGGEVRVGQPAIALDLQNRVLLRWQPETGPVRWIWLERSRDCVHWEALRRAVYSRAGTSVPPAGEPPTA